MLTGIVAISKDAVIGHNGKIPWHVPEDLAFFRQETFGAAIIMGRKTFESLRKPLDRRLNVVLSKEGSVNGLVTKISSIEEAQPIIDSMRTYVIGGTLVYTAFSQMITHWIVTHIPIEVGLSDTYFPTVLLNGFKSTKEDTIRCKDGKILTVEYLERK